MFVVFVQNTVKPFMVLEPIVVVEFTHEAVIAYALVKVKGNCTTELLDKVALNPYCKVKELLILPDYRIK